MNIESNNPNRIKTVLCVSGATFLPETETYGGSAEAGKDLFSILLHEFLSKKNISVNRIAFGDHLKFLASTINEAGMHPLVSPYDDEVRYKTKEYFNLPDEWKWNGSKKGGENNPLLSHLPREIREDFGRNLLQILGTEIGRGLCENIWVESAWNMILQRRYYPFDENERTKMILSGTLPNSRSENPDVIVITDNRFPNEINGMRSFVENNSIPLFFKIEVTRHNHDNKMSPDKRRHLSEARLSLQNGCSSDYSIYNNANDTEIMKKSVKTFAESFAKIIERQKYKENHSKIDVENIEPYRR